MHVAIVDDDPFQCGLIARACEAHGIGATRFHYGTPFLRHAANEPFDLAFIDLRLPDIHGLELLRQLRAQSERLISLTPAMVVTGCHDTAAMKEAFDCGALDFVVKPIHSESLIIRAQAIVRQAQPRLFEDAPLCKGPLTLNLATLQAFVNGQEVHLSGKEFKILWLLARQEGRTVTRSEVARLVWGAPLANASRTIDAHVARLRKKLTLGHQPTIRLRPSYGVGYCLDVFS